MPSDRNSPTPPALTTSDALLPKTEPLLRLVIAAPDADARLMYREALRGLPFDIVEAADGRDALVQCLLERPAVLITDSHLPTVTGYELCRILRHDRETHAVPILVVTSEGRPTELTRLRQLGATLVLQKPITIDGFATTVTDLCVGTATTPDTGPYGETSATGVQQPLPESRGLRAASKSYHRFETTQPPALPPELRCRLCDVALDYRTSRVGGVTKNEPEQWDEFRCPRCAMTFEYRHRTRSLRAIA
jgi:CheY-like chemotaxis protein